MRLYALWSLEIPAAAYKRAGRDFKHVMILSNLLLSKWRSSRALETRFGHSRRRLPLSRDALPGWKHGLRQQPVGIRLRYMARRLFQADGSVAARGPLGDGAR